MYISVYGKRNFNKYVTKPLCMYIVHYVVTSFFNIHAACLGHRDLKIFCRIKFICNFLLLYMWRIVQNRLRR